MPALDDGVGMTGLDAISPRLFALAPRSGQREGRGAIAVYAQRPPLSLALSPLRAGRGRTFVAAAQRSPFFGHPLRVLQSK